MTRQTRRRLRHGLIVFGALAVLAASWERVPIFRSLERASLDFRYARFNRDTKASDRIVVIDIDEQSIKLLAPSYGRWPWPRRAYKDLVEFLSAGEPAGIFFDILFTESQQNSGDDKLLGQASARSGRVSHAMEFLESAAEEGKEPKLPEGFAGKFALQWDGGVPEFERPVLKDFLVPAPDLLASVPKIHVVTFSADSDGEYRHTPMAFLFGGQWYPSLSLSALQALAPGKVSYSPGEIAIHGPEKTLRVPVGTDGSYPIHFYRNDDHGPRIVPFAAAIDSAIKMQKGEVSDPAELKVNPLELKDKVIMIGASAAGLEDLKVTPISGAYSGVLLHATTVSNILDGDTLMRAPGWARLLLALAVIAAVLGSSLFLDAILLKTALPLLLMAVYSALAIELFHAKSVQLDLALPLTAGLLALFDGLAFATFVESGEKRRMQSTLSKYLSPSVTESLIATGANPQAEVGRAEELSILFSDIRGFTTLSEQLQPGAVVARLNDYLGEMTEVVFRHKGTLDKFIGDAVMSFWGAPLKDDLHARNAIECGMEMHVRLAELRARWRKLGVDVDLKIGVGVNTGVVIVGNIGSERKLDYTVIGDNVNLASRIEGLTKQYGVGFLVGERTREVAGDSLVWRRIDQVRVKGKANHVTIYEPIAPAGADADKARELAERFEDGFALYLKAEFQKAVQHFEKLNESRGGSDGPTKVYLERCRHLAEDPPKEWDGIYVAKSK
jgi:adenylate cyclase